MRHVITRTLALCAIMLAAGCASSGTAKTPLPPGYKAPILLSTSTRPDLHFPSGVNSIKVNIEVMVDASGTPDPNTLKLSGTGAEENRDAVLAWLTQVSIKPATVNDVPVAGLFKAGFGVSRSVQRVR